MQSRRGSCRETFNNSPAVRASTGGASSLNASGRLLARTTRSVISSNPRYRLRSGEASLPSATPLSDMQTSCTCRVGYVGQLALSRNWGSSQLAKLRDYSSTSRLDAVVGSFTWEPISLSPVGEPGSASPFSRIGAFPGKQFLRYLRVIRKAVLRKPNRRLLDLPPWCDRGCLSGFILRNLPSNRAVFS